MFSGCVCERSVYRTTLAGFGLCELVVWKVRTGQRSRGSAPSAALGRLEDGAPASRVRYALWVAYPSGEDIGGW